MATDYKKINTESRIDLRSIRDQRGDKTHFVYELIQNADDSKSKRLELHLCEKELLVWNDGCKFCEEDIRRISSIGYSDKDLTQIGNFGTGFKSVYNYTDRPEVYSGDERFCLPDPTGISKTLADLASSSLVEGIDKVPPRIAELVEEGKTVFRLPFKENLRPEDLMLLKNQLRELLKKRSLLFLPHLETIQWHDIYDEQTGIYRRYLHRKIQNADQVELKATMNGEDLESERFLVFFKKFQPRWGVIDELLQMEHDEKRRKRIQETGEKLQPIEVAFKLQDGRVTALNSCVLFAYLPTEKETHLRFFIQARYQTNPARNDIEKTEQNPWNRWLVEETAEFLPEVLEELKEAGLLDPAFFNVLPLNGKVENDFKPIADASKEAMRSRSLVPTQDGGYAKAENVFYPHHRSLRKLVECSWIYPDSSWLHSDIGLSGHAFDVMREAGVKEINASQVLNWLEKQDLNWFEGRCEKWLRSLYVYLLKCVYPNNQKFQLDRVKKLPLVRLGNGKHVSAAAQSVFFPPDTDEAREEIESFLKDLPILQSSLLAGEECNAIEGFLEKHLEVRPLRPETLIHKWMIPQYSQSEKPSEKENISHVRYLFKVWDKLSGYKYRELREKIRNIPILQVHNSVSEKNCDFVASCGIYLSQPYTGDADLETYFSVCNGDIWFVDHVYLEDDSNRKDWCKFLKAIGAMNTPATPDVGVPGSSEECENRGITYEKSTKPFKDGEFKDMLYRRPYEYFDGHIIDASFDGLSEVLTQIGNHNKINLPKALWGLLVKLVSSLPSEERRRNAFFRDLFQGTYYWSHNGTKQTSFDATFYRQLKETAWLPDEQGNLYQPSELFAPTDSNRRLLGDSVAYLHPDFNISQANEVSQWLAGKLGIYLSANTESVLNYLQTLSGTEASVKKVEPLYRFLERQNARPRDEFKEKPLIFTSNPESSWWRTDEAFWEDESEIFKNNRGYLKVHYPETLKPFFIALRVSEQAAQSDYASGIQEITTTEQAAKEEVRARVGKLYRSLISWQANQWKIIYDSRCWLGQKGNEWGFFSRNELVWDDHRYIADIFQGEVPFWTFDDLLDLTEYLKIEGCSQAKVEFHPEGDQEDDAHLSMRVRNLHPYIHAFLNSHRLCEAPTEGKSADVLYPLSVRFVEELKTSYTLKEISLTSPNPRPSFLEVTNEEVTLWLALAADKDDYASLIGDALQDYFRVKDLGRFTEHLLTKTIDSVLDRWKREGLRTDLCVSRSDREEDQGKTAELIDEKLQDSNTEADAYLIVDESEVEFSVDSDVQETSNEDSDSGADESKLEMPVNEKPETSIADDNSAQDKPKTRTYIPRTNRTNRSAGHSTSRSKRANADERQSSRGDDRGNDTHTEEKDIPHHTTKEIERIGMKYACRYEEERGCTIKDVSAQNVGFDLYSTTQNGEIRCIEVKARAERDLVVLTPNEWHTAERLNDDYFLYVVLNAATQPELYIIHPIDEVEVREVEEVRYQVPLREIIEHGKLVL